MEQRTNKDCCTHYRRSFHFPLKQVYCCLLVVVRMTRRRTNHYLYLVRSWMIPLVSVRRRQGIMSRSRPWYDYLRLPVLAVRCRLFRSHHQVHSSPKKNQWSSISLGGCHKEHRAGAHHPVFSMPMQWVRLVRILERSTQPNEYEPSVEAPQMQIHILY